MARTETPTDPTRVREQPQLRRPNPGMWLAPAGALAAIAIALFALNMPVNATLARLGILLEGALFAAMVAVTIARPPQRRMGAWFAVLMLAMAGVALALLVVLANVAWMPAPA